MQISTDATAKIIVGVGISQAAADAAELVPALERIAANLGQTPQQMVVDNGFTNQTTIEAMADTPIDLIGALADHSAQSERALRKRGVSPEFFPQAFGYDPVADTYTCPAGQTLTYEGKEKKGTATRYRYRAKPSACQACPFKAQCCPENKKGRSIVRTEDSPAVAAFKAKMRTEAAQPFINKGPGWPNFPTPGLKLKSACVSSACEDWRRSAWKPCGPV